MHTLAIGRRALLGGLAAVAMIFALPVSANAQLASTPTPYMGWNTYYGVGGGFNEATIKSVANSLISSGLAAAGYKIVWLDFGWWGQNWTRDSSGNLIVDPTDWPDGMAGFDRMASPARPRGRDLHRCGPKRLLWVGCRVLRALPTGREPVRRLAL
jgi:hypothetical protein